MHGPQSEETLVDLAGEVVHDLRNILQCLLSHAESALAGKSKNDPVFGLLSDMESLILKGRDLSERFLAYDKGRSANPALLNCNIVIRDLKKLLEPQIPESISFITQLDENLHAIMGDRALCEQMLMNLCLNAISAMPEGGRLQIRTQNIDLDAEKRISAEAVVPAGAFVLLTVEDTGVGMTREQKARIFERFYTTKSQGKGTGLGLTVVRSVIESLGGFIACTSSINEGSRFSLYIPKAPDEDFGESADNWNQAIRTGGAEAVILVVDDEQVILKFMEILLESFGYRVLTAQNEEDAIEIITFTQPNLVILDCGLPGKGGIFLFHELQRILPGTKTLFISGFPIDYANIDQRYLHQTNFLAKPFTQQELMAQVEALLKPE